MFGQLCSSKCLDCPSVNKAHLFTPICHAPMLPVFFFKYYRQSCLLTLLLQNISFLNSTGVPQSLVPGPFSSLWSQVLSGGRGYPSLWSQVPSAASGPRSFRGKGEGVPQPLVPGSFPRRRGGEWRGWYPIQLLVPLPWPDQDRGYTLPLPAPGQDQDRRYPLPTPLARTRTGVAPLTPSDSTRHGQDTERAVRHLRSCGGLSCVT